MIPCLTPNPAIDRTLYLNLLHIGEVYRAEKVLTAAGGKGLNVARAIRTLINEPGMAVALQYHPKIMMG